MPLIALLIGVVAGAALPFGEAPYSLLSTVGTMASLVISVITGVIIAVWASYTTYQTQRLTDIRKHAIGQINYLLGSLRNARLDEDRLTQLLEIELSDLSCLLHSTSHELEKFETWSNAFRECFEALCVSPDKTVDELVDELIEYLACYSAGLESLELPIRDIYIKAPWRDFVHHTSFAINRVVYSKRDRARAQEMIKRIDRGEVDIHELTAFVRTHRK